MGLKLLFFMSLALSLHRLSIASPMELRPISSIRPFHVPPKFTVWGNFKHGNLIDYHVPPPDQVLSVQIHDVFHDTEVQDLVAHLAWTIKNPEYLSALSSKSPVSWTEDGEIYRKLETKQQKEIDNFLQKHVIRASRDKLVAEDVKWLMESKPTWWNQKFIEENLKNKQYKQLVAIGDLLKFHQGTKLTPDYVVNELHPSLKEILVSNGNVRASPLNLKPLAAIKNNKDVSILAERVSELETIFPALEKGPEMLKMLRSASSATPKPH